MINYKKIALYGVVAMAVAGGAFAGGSGDLQAAAPDTVAISSQQNTVSLRYFGQPAGVKGSATPYGNNVKNGHYVQSGDAKLYYEVYGQGTPVLVLHGGGVGTPYELGHIIDKLRDGSHQVIVMSTRGHGRSEIGHTPLSFAQRAADAETVLKAVTDKKAIVVAFSDGAYTSYALAKNYPQSVDRIVAIGAGTLRKGYYDANSGDWEALRKADPEFIAQQEKLAPEPQRLDQWFKDYMKFWSQASVGKDELSAISCPVLLIAGDEDDHAPVATMLEAADLIPNSRLCIVPKAWHTAFLDNEAVVLSTLLPFVETKDAAALTPSKKVAYNTRFVYQEK